MGITNQIVLREDVFYAMWRFTFESQLRELHAHLNVVDEGQEHHFRDMPFEDFCILTYTERPEFIDLSQN